MLTTGKAWNGFLMPNTCGKCRSQANAFVGWQTTERRMRTTQGCPTLRLIGSPGARTSGSRRPALRFSRSLVRVTTTRRSQSPPTRMGAYGTRSTFSTSVQERSSTTSPTSRPPWKLLSGGPAGWSASEAFHVLWTRNRQAGVVTQHSTDHGSTEWVWTNAKFGCHFVACLLDGWMVAGKPNERL